MVRADLILSYVTMAAVGSAFVFGSKMAAILCVIIGSVMILIVHLFILRRKGLRRR